MPPTLPVTPVEKPRSKRRIIIWVASSILALIIVTAGIWYTFRLLMPPVSVSQVKTAKQSTESPSDASTPIASGPQLDIAKNYGNKYANGLLPVGDNNYSTTAAKKGTVYACSQYAQNFANDKGGAGTRGPWFTNNSTQYNIKKKARVSGTVSWKGSFSNTISGDKRIITTNDLPLNHATGTFPIASTDAAYSYDKNPNKISAQSLTFTIPAAPTYGPPQCMGGEVGVMLTGVALFNAFDAGGRDAGAWEVQDSCAGHPQMNGEYHYHTLSSCIKDVSVRTVIGFALDGFPITGPQIGADSILTTSDLDECHGTISEIILDGKPATTYHYVMTEDFPYSASCFRSTASQPPAMQGGTGQGGQQPAQQSQTQGAQQQPRPATAPQSTPPPPRR